MPSASEREAIGMKEHVGLAGRLVRERLLERIDCDGIAHNISYVDLRAAPATGALGGA
jgi:hypothetical protein